MLAKSQARNTSNVICCDGLGTIALAKSLESHSRTNYIDECFLPQVEKGPIVLEYFFTKENAANRLTKALPRAAFEVKKKHKQIALLKTQWKGQGAER